jgi:hypothetical protein
MSWFDKDAMKSPKTVNPFSVYSVLRELVSHLVTIRDEQRALRKEVERNHEEVMMAFSDLKANVEQLITLAEAAAAAGAAAAAAPTGTPATDIDALNQRVIDALHVLTPPVAQAATSAGTPQPPAVPVAPPSPDAASTVNAPAPGPQTDPNAPAQPPV